MVTILCIIICQCFLHRNALLLFVLLKSYHCTYNIETEMMGYRFIYLIVLMFLLLYIWIRLDISTACQFQSNPRKLMVDKHMHTILVTQTC